MRLPRLHPLLLLLLAAGAALGRVDVLVVYLLSLLLHESSHLAVARALGFEVGRIDLYPFGGYAEIPGIELRGPLAEILVTLAGPAGNLLALGVGATLWRFALADALRARLIVDANLAMLAVNLLPAFPLDGGRILRAVRAQSVGISAATEEALLLGRAVCAVLLGVGAVAQLAGYAGWQLAVLGAVVFSASRKELRRAPFARWALWLRAMGALSRGEVLPLQALAAAPGSELRAVLRHLFGQRAHRVYIFDRGRMIATLDDNALYRAVEQGNLGRTMAEIAKGEDDG